MVIGAWVGLVLQPIFTLASLITFVILTSFFVMPQAIIPLLLVVRSSLDIFSKVGFKVGPMLLNIPSLTSLLILCFGGAYIILNICIKKYMAIDRVGKAFFLWISTLLFWVFIAYNNFHIDGLAGLREWIRLASLFTIYALSYQLAQIMDYRNIIRYIFFALPVPLLLGLYQVITSTGIKVDGINRVSGTLAHPNSFALFLVLFIGLTLWKVISKKNKALWLLLLMTEMFVLINTFSIGGIAMFIIMCTVLIFRTMKKKYRIIGAVFVLSVIIGFSLHPAGQLRIAEISRTGDPLEAMKTGRISGEGSFAWRILNWRMFFEEWKERPLLGYGLSTTTEMVSPMGNIPHNDYLRFMVETGLIGLLVFLWFLILLGKEIWKACCASNMVNPEFSNLAFIVFSIYMAWVAGSFADNFITATGFQYYFWALLGILMGQSHKLRVLNKIMR
jgi:O-antigen ligase